MDDEQVEIYVRYFLCIYFFCEICSIGMTQPPVDYLSVACFEERGFYLTRAPSSVQIKRETQLFKPLKSVIVNTQTMSHYVALSNEAGFHIFIEFGVFYVLSEWVIVMRTSKLMKTRTLSQFCGALIGCLILKLESQQQEGEEPHYHGQVGRCRTGVVEIRGRERGVAPQSVSLVHLQNKKSKWDLFYHLIISLYVWFSL